MMPTKATPSTFSSEAGNVPPAPAACACVTSAQVEALYSAAAAGGAKMTRPISAGGPLEAPEALNVLIPPERADGGSQAA